MAFRDEVRASFRRATRHLRPLPDFLIIGGRKCGTTTLYNYLIQTPHVNAAVKKSPHFFNTDRYNKGIDFYRSNFSFKSKKGLSGEATASYFDDPLAADRISKELPDIKLILLLRNPVDRAYSDFQHKARRGDETDSFESTLDRDTKDVFDYLHAGKYTIHLERWLDKFSREQLMILKSEDFFKNPADNLNKVLNFIDLPNHTLPTYKVYQTGKYYSYPEMSDKTRKRLELYFQPHNQRLQDLYNISWSDIST